MEWEPDNASPMCRLCNRKWTMFKYRRHHCRNCGKLVCYKCSMDRIYLTIKSKQAERVCDKCATQIRSTEGTPLPPGALDEDDPDESDAEIQSVVSDGKCKATETPFRNTMSMNKPPANLTAMVQGMEEVEESDEEDEDEGDFGSPEEKGKHTLNLEEMHLHRSPSGTPLSAGAASAKTDATGTGSERTDDTAQFVLTGLNSGVHRENSLNPDHTLKSSVSKFGVMTFSDEERSEGSARHSVESEVVGEEEVQTFSASELPWEAGKNADGYSLKHASAKVEPAAEAPAEVQGVCEKSAEPVVAENAAASEPAKVTVTADASADSTASASEPVAAPAGTTPTSTESATVTAADQESAQATTDVSTESTKEASAETAAESSNATTLVSAGAAAVPMTTETAAAAATSAEATTAETATAAETAGAETTTAAKSTTPKTRKIVLGKKNSPIRTEMDTTPSTSSTGAKLHAGLSPMPAGSTVRRLSVLTPRTPFNSAVTMSPAAAEIAAAQAKALTEAAAAQAGEAPESAPSVTAQEQPSSQTGSEGNSSTPSAEVAVPAATEESAAGPSAEASTTAAAAPAAVDVAEPVASTETAPAATSEQPALTDESSLTQERESNADLESVYSTESGERKSESKRGGRGGRGNSGKGGKKVWK